MSSATIIVGCPFDEIFTKVNQPVKKFDADTGKPYLKDNFVWSLCGSIIEETDEYVDCCPDSYLPQGFSYASYHDEERSSKIVGVMVKEVSDDNYGGFSYFKKEKLELAEAKAKKLFESIGYKGEVQPYLVLACSY